MQEVDRQTTPGTPTSRRRPCSPPHPAQGRRRRPARSGMFPAVHAQDKIVLRYLGTAVNQDKRSPTKFKADTGIEIQYVAVNTDDVTKRAVTAPNSSTSSTPSISR